MSENLTFMMGEFPAEIAGDRHYIRNHMWAVEQNERVIRFGLSAYAVRLLQDIYFIEFNVDAGGSIQSRQEIGMIESKKAESGIYAPCAGKLSRINPEVLTDPSVINVDKYGQGWLFEIEPIAVELLSPSQYILHLGKAWDLAQKTIKGQANAD